jgi:hypothetical protein
VGNVHDFKLVKKLKDPFQIQLAGATVQESKLFNRISVIEDFSPFLIQERNVLLKCKKQIEGLKELHDVLPFYEMALVYIDQQEMQWYESGPVRNSFVPMQEIDLSTCNPNQLTSFYQSSDGTPMFLHWINFKCLSHQFMNESLPFEISGKILEIEAFQQDENTLKRFRFLNHIPLYSRFFMCELDLSHILSKSTKGK